MMADHSSYIVTTLDRTKWTERKRKRKKKRGEKEKILGKS